MQAIECGSVVRRLSSVAVLALAVLTGPVLAQKADRPNVKVGDRWLFAMRSGPGAAKLDLAWVAKSVTPAGVERTASGQQLALTPDLNAVESPRRKNSGAKGRVSYNVAVVGYEKVRVAAGEFDAFKLEAKGSYSGTGGEGNAIRKYWYAPAARAVVKGEYWDTYRGSSTIELVEFQLQP